MKKLLSIVLVLLLSVAAYAEIEWQRFSYFNNVGGLNNTFSPIAIGDNEASDIQNMVFDTAGHIKTRDGYAKLNSSTLGLTLATVGLKFYKQADGDKYLVAVFDDGTIRKMDYQSGGGPDGTWDDITGSLVFTNTPNVFASFAVGEDTLIIEDGIGTTAPYQWTGTGNASALSGSPPNCTIVAYHKNMGFCAGNSAAQSTLYFSNLGDIADWIGTLSGNISIDTNDGTIIRAIFPGFDALYIWKDKSIWRLTGDDKDSFQLQRMISNVGTLCSTCIDKIGNEFIFLSDQGKVYLYDGAVNLKLVSPKIQYQLEEQTSFSRLQYATGVVLDNDYHLSVSPVGTGENSSVLFFDSFNLAWSKFSGMEANAMAIADDGNGQDMIVFGDYGGFVYQYPSGETDAGTSISSFYITKWFTYPEFKSNLKDLKKIYTYSNVKGNYDMFVDVYVDFEDTANVYTVPLSGSATPTYGTSRFEGNHLVADGIEPNLEGTFFKMKFYQTTQPIEVKGWDTYVQPSDRI